MAGEILYMSIEEAVVVSYGIYIGRYQIENRYINFFRVVCSLECPPKHSVADPKSIEIQSVIKAHL